MVSVSGVRKPARNPIQRLPEEEGALPGSGPQHPHSEEDAEEAWQE